MPASWYEFNLASPEVATIRIYDEIGGFGVSASDFISELDRVDVPLVRVHLNSPGGSVDEGLAIMNALISHKAVVETHVDAAAYSIASVIAQGADPGKRYMAPHSRMMVHEAMALGMGYAADFEKVAEHLRETTANISQIYAERSGRESAYWLGKMAAETRFTAEQAVEEGLADEVGRATNLEAFRVAANFDWTKFRFSNVAEIKAELEAVAGKPEETHIPTDHLETLEKSIDAAYAALKAIRESNKAPEVAPDGGPKSSLNPIEARRIAVDEILAGIR